MGRYYNANIRGRYDCRIGLGKVIAFADAWDTDYYVVKYDGHDQYSVLEFDQREVERARGEKFLVLHISPKTTAAGVRFFRDDE